MAQHLGYAQHQVGGRHALAQCAGQLKTHHVGRQEVHRLAQHGGLRLDTTHAPAHDADPVDHGGVAVGADQGVGVVHRRDLAPVCRAGLLGLVHAAGQELEVDLVHDAKARRHHAKGVKGLHAPLHELVALAIALELQLHVQVQRVLVPVVVHHDRVVHHEINRNQRLDAGGVQAQLSRLAAHGSQVRQKRHTGEVLQHHAAHHKGDFLRALGVGLPVGQAGHVGRQHLPAIAVAHHALEHDAQGQGEPVDVGVFTRQLRQRIKLPRLAGGGLKSLKGMGKCVRHNGLLKGR